MATRAASGREAALHPPGKLLLQLPAPAQRAVIDRLEPASCGRLRLACKSAQRLVDEAVTTLNMLELRRAGDLSGVRSRFLNLRELSVCGYHNSSVAEHNAQVDAIAQLTGPQPWPAVQAMHLERLADAALALAISRCPSLTSCFVSCSGSGLRQEAMCALARCSSLANLNFSAGSPTAAGTTALLGMTSLTSLTYGYELGDSSVIDTDWDMRGMTALQSLNVQRSLQQGDWYDPDDVEEEDDVMEAEQARLEAWDKQVYGTMLLPPSLFSLSLDHLPTPLFALPSLVSFTLTLHRRTATDEVLARLAAGCPCLKQLCVDSLNITKAAHTAPLTELSRLVVAAYMDTAAGVRLAGAFPALRSLRLEHESSFAEPEGFFVGASSLEFLAASCGESSSAIHWSMPVGTFKALAALQQLTTVHLNAEPAHVEGLQMLTQLTKVIWTVHTHTRPEMLDKVQLAFATFNAPARLSHAKILFSRKYAWPQHALELRLDGIVDAIILWLVQAPALEHVVWERQKPGPGALTAAWLGALTVSNTIGRITIDVGEAPVLPLPLMHMARVVAINRQVCVQIKGIDI